MLFIYSVTITCSCDQPPVRWILVMHLQDTHPIWDNTCWNVHYGVKALVAFPTQIQKICLIRASLCADIYDITELKFLKLIFNQCKHRKFLKLEYISIIYYFFYLWAQQTLYKVNLRILTSKSIMSHNFFFDKLLMKTLSLGSTQVNFPNFYSQCVLIYLMFLKG